MVDPPKKDQRQISWEKSHSHAHELLDHFDSFFLVAWSRTEEGKVCWRSARAGLTVEEGYVLGRYIVKDEHKIFRGVTIPRALDVADEGIESFQEFLGNTDEEFQDYLKRLWKPQRCPQKGHNGKPSPAA